MSEEESQLYPPMVFFSFSFFSNGLTKTKNQKPKKKKIKARRTFLLCGILFITIRTSLIDFFVFSTYSYYPLKRGYQKNIARPLFMSFLPSRITTFLLSSLALNHFYKFEIFLS